jgi:Na+-translocating ferredoxin:NAD+ oxidoreductase subunit B
MKDIYRNLAKVLDTLPNGFPETKSGVELSILKKVFEPDEAELFCDLKLTFETPEEIAARTGRPLEGLADKLYSMWKNGLVFMVDFGVSKVYKMMPWVFGIFEFQVNRMDRQFAELVEAYRELHHQFFNNTPQLMTVVPVEKQIPATHVALPYESVSAIIEKGLSFGVAQCVCKQTKNLLDKGCKKPQEVCIGIAPVPGVFETHFWGRPISMEDARKILDMAEENALVHLSWNIQDGQFFICNCCGCCCEVLRSMTELGCEHSVNSSFYAFIDPETCIGCGVCGDERCQVNAIAEEGDVRIILKDKCIGCGLCVSTCPADAISLVRKPAGDVVRPPANENSWYLERGKIRGVDFSKYL